MIFLARYGATLEREVFSESLADYLYMMLFMTLTLDVIAYPMRLAFAGIPLIFAIMYVWSRKFPEMTVSFMFGFSFKGFYLPWVLLGFNFLTGGSGVNELLGIGIGHAYYFLKDAWPENSRRPSPLETPAFMYRLFPRAGSVPVPQAPWGGAFPNPWGGGQRLGR